MARQDNDAASSRIPAKDVAMRDVLHKLPYAKKAE